MAHHWDRRADLPVYPKQKLVFAWNTIFIIIAFFAVVLRFIGRRMKRVRPGIDDILIALALIAFLAQAIIVYFMILYGGVGNPSATLSPDEAVVYTKLATAVQFPYGFSMAFVRYSIVALLIRVFAVSKFRIVCYGILGVITAGLLQVIIAAAILCEPFEKNWNPALPGHCGDPDVSYIAIVAVGIFTDLLIFISPMPMVWQLQMPTRQKVAITLVFALGLADILIAIFRIVVTSAGYLDVIVPSLILGASEPAVAILVACCPMYRPFVDKIVPRSIREYSFRSHNAASKQYIRTSDTTNDGDIELMHANVSTHALASNKAPTDHGNQEHSDEWHDRKRAFERRVEEGKIGIEQRVDVYAE